MTAPDSGYTNYPCDLCGTDAPIEVPHARTYSGDQPIHICSGCGFVYVRARRSSAEIARVWSEEIFGSVYTAVKNPAMLARQTYVAEFLAAHVDLAGRRVCDIGAGEGLFLDYLARKFGVRPFAIEPSPGNAVRLADLGIPFFTGTIEQFNQDADAAHEFDVVTIMWTLENCFSCIDMLEGAAALLPEGGHIVVATGSRILVPFKKPLFTYFSRNPADSHCFRFSANALQTALALAGFRTVVTNRYIDNDNLCVLAAKAPPSEPLPVLKDQPLEVAAFFERWHQDTQYYLSDWQE